MHPHFHSGSNGESYESFRVPLCTPGPVVFPLPSSHPSFHRALFLSPCLAVCSLLHPLCAFQCVPRSSLAPPLRMSSLRAVRAVPVWSLSSLPRLASCSSLPCRSGSSAGCTVRVTAAPAELRSWRAASAAPEPEPTHSLRAARQGPSAAPPPPDPPTHRPSDPVQWELVRLPGD